MAECAHIDGTLLKAARAPKSARRPFGLRRFPISAFTRATCFPSCLAGVVALDNFSTNVAGGVGSATGVGPGFDAIAETLGVDDGALRQAMEDAGGHNADLNPVEDQLGVSVDALQ
jgi:hypothetical protein